MGNGLPTIIYLIRSGFFYKIGRTTDLKSRVKDIQVSCAEPIEIVATVVGEPALEKQLHRQFAAKRTQGEWFRLDEDDVAYLCELMGIPRAPRVRQRRPVGHVQELPNGRWRLYAKLPSDPASGRRRQASKVIRVPNRRAALDELAIFVTAVGEQIAPATRDRTLGDLLDAWLRHASASETTIFSWREALDRYIRPHVGTLPLDQLTSQALDELYLTLGQSGGKDGGALSAATIRKAHSAVRLACAQGVRWGWLPVNPALNARPKAAPKRVVTDPPSLEQVTGLIEKADPDFSAWLRVVAHLGLRREEGLGLRWSDVDVDDRTVTIKRVVTLVGGRMVIVDYPKTSSSLRTVAISETVTAALRQMRVRYLAGVVALGVPNQDGYVLSPEPDGSRPYYPDSATRRLARLCETAGIPDVTIRQLRHYFATRALSRGHDVRTVAGRGGWANANTLLSVYAHFLPARDRALADDDDVVDTDVG